MSLASLRILSAGGKRIYERAFMPAVKYIHVFCDASTEASYRRIREHVLGLTGQGWKCQSVYFGGGKATAWLVNPAVQPQTRGDRQSQH